MHLVFNLWGIPLVQERVRIGEDGGMKHFRPKSVLLQISLGRLRFILI
jgi:hypothetical protein